MSSFRSSGSNHGTKSSSISQKKPSFLIRFIKGTFFQIFVFFTTVIVLGVAYASWTTINPSQGADGQPVTQTLMQGMINNINDLNTRLQTINPSGTNLSAGKIQINDVVTEGTACSPDGLVGRDASGLLLSCQSGTWFRSGIIGRYRFHVSGYTSWFEGYGVYGAGTFNGYVACSSSDYGAACTLASPSYSYHCGVGITACNTYFTNGFKGLNGVWGASVLNIPVNSVSAL